MRNYDEWIFKHAVDWASKTFLEEGEMMPTLIGYKTGKDVEIHVFPLPFSNDDEKLSLLQMARMYMMVRDINHYVVMHEAWMVKAPPGTERLDCQPKDHPERIESLIVMSISHKRKRMKSFYIKRDLDGKVIDLEAHEPDYVGEPSGRFTDLLTPPGFQPTPEQIRIFDLVMAKVGINVTTIEPEDLSEKDEN